MNYIPLEDYRYRWFFSHKDLPVDSTDLQKIKPIASDSAIQIWQQLISNRANHSELFHKDDWPKLNQTWSETVQWQDAWDGEETGLPRAVLDALNWEPETVVYFCYHSENIIETNWQVFEKNWKNFLFLDDGPILIGKRRAEALQFLDDGQVKIGVRGIV